MSEYNPYNPLDKRVIGVGVAKKLEKCPMSSLPPKDRFVGSGIYALYYRGDFELYKPLTQSPIDIPIYVGSATPPGGRKGLIDATAKPGYKMHSRLVKHSESISDANNLMLADFSCKYLVLDDVWIRLGEAMLINKYKPLWNQVLEGFGNKTVGKERVTQKIPTWDFIHPGRPWTTKMHHEGLNKDDIALKIKEHLERSIARVDEE